MRWVSNTESARKGEPSVLAIAETLAAMGLSLWFAIHFGTVKHIVFGACLAPFLLMRTDESAALGIRVFQRAREKTLEKTSVDSVTRNLCGGAGFVAFAPIRMFATIVTVVRSPVAVVRAIPGNWRRITVATDSCRSPQFLPTPDDPAVIRELLVDLDDYNLYAWFGKSTLCDEILEARCSHFTRTDREREDLMSAHPNVGPWLLKLMDWLEGWLTPVGRWNDKWLVLIPIAGLPTVLYRWSLKSTAIIWFPLLWALRPVAPSDAPVRARLRLFERDDFFRFLLLVSATALFLFAAKLVFWNELAQASNAWNVSMGGRILRIYVAPSVVEWWQLATALNSAIAIGLWLYVRSWLRHAEEGALRRELVIERLLAWGLFVRRLLTTYTILCVGYLYLHEVTTWRFPTLGGKLFPWM